MLTGDLKPRQIGTPAAKTAPLWEALINIDGQSPLKEWIRAETKAAQALRAQQIQPCQIGPHLGTGNRALIDTDLYLFKAAAGSTFTFKWDDDNRVG